MATPWAVYAVLCVAVCGVAVGGDILPSLPSECRQCVEGLYNHWPGRENSQA